MKFGSNPKMRGAAILRPAGTPWSAFGNVSAFSTFGSNLLSTAIVVMPLSVKTRWNSVAGVRASYCPPETRTTVWPLPCTSHARPARGCHCFRSLGLTDVVEVDVGPGAQAVTPEHRAQVVGQLVARGVERARAPRIAAQVAESGDRDEREPGVRDLVAVVRRELSANLVQQGRSERGRETALQADALALSHEVGGDRLVVLRRIEVEVLSAQMRVGALHVEQAAAADDHVGAREDGDRVVRGALLTLLRQQLRRHRDAGRLSVELDEVRDLQQ